GPTDRNLPEATWPLLVQAPATPPGSRPATGTGNQGNAPGQGAGNQGNAPGSNTADQSTASSSQDSTGDTNPASLPSSTTPEMLGDHLSDRPARTPGCGGEEQPPCPPPPKPHKKMAAPQAPMPAAILDPSIRDFKIADDESPRPQCR